jgi:NAD(P)-dependent dehydrogenase (short-subunit alcohol dehydrogenase family)
MRLKGKTCLITGANSGLGFALAKQLAAQDTETIMVCRSPEKGDKAILEIKNENPDASVKLMRCDLSSMKSIQSFIQEFKSKHSKLDVLYNNAAVMKKNRTITEDGFEMMFQVNYLAAFILMNAFLGLLKHGSSPMIINNGRPSDKLRLDLDDLQFSKDYHMYRSFFKTKLCLLFASLELSRRKESESLSVTMIDPGPFKSDLVRDIPLAGWVKNLMSAPADKAAGNMLHHITADEVKEKNGKVFREKQEYPLTAYWKDTDVSERLWSATESLLEGKMQ